MGPDSTEDRHSRSSAFIRGPCYFWSRSLAHAQTTCPATPAYLALRNRFRADPRSRRRIPIPTDRRTASRIPLAAPPNISHARLSGMAASRMVIRFAPTEAGDWDYRVTSNLQPYKARPAQFTATASESPGFHARPPTCTISPTRRDWQHAPPVDGRHAMRFARDRQRDVRQVCRTRARPEVQPHSRQRCWASRRMPAKAFPKPDAPDPGYFSPARRTHPLHQPQRHHRGPAARRRRRTSYANLFPDWQQRAALRPLPGSALRRR